MSENRVPKTPSRVFEASGTTRSNLLVDSDTLHRMIETFGPLEYSQFVTAFPPQSTVIEGWSRDDFPSQNQPYTSHYLLSKSLLGDNQPDNTSSVRKESLLEWFDRSVEKELEKRRDPSGSPTTFAMDPALSPMKQKHTVHMSKDTAERLAETSASRIEMASKLTTDFTTELSDAVEKLAQAEQMCSYVEALNAAETAAQNAPPEKAEEAAQAGARSIQSKLTKVKETIPGIRPIEVVGYVGITQPHTAKQS